MTSELMEPLRAQLETALGDGLTDECMGQIKKQVNDLIYEIESDIDWRVKSELAPNLSAFVVDMAEKAVRAILDGNQAEMERYLGCERGHWTGRSDSPEYGAKRKPHEWHTVIHGRLFDCGAMAVRRALVEAHRDLIADQRILDLEDQVRSLVAQVNKCEAEKEPLVERLRDAGAW